MEHTTELPVCGFSNYAKIKVSRQIHLHRVTTIWFVFSSENLHALDFSTLEQRIPRHAALATTPCDGNTILLSLFSLIFSSRVRAQVSSVEAALSFLIKL